MATDMSALAHAVALRSSDSRLATALRQAGDQAKDKGILERLAIFGFAISSSVKNFESKAFAELRTHQSDVVRQWGAYAVNDPSRKMTLAERLAFTRLFAADRHMSVRECAWMAFRPHLSSQLTKTLQLLARVSRSHDENERRFAVEVSRPRSVWGRHIQALKEKPELATPLLTSVRQDQSRYVKLAVGNWLNDASKSRPDWVLQVCSAWSATSDPHTKFIVNRGLRTLRRNGRVDISVRPNDAIDRAIGGVPC